jgi:class 3 adenylate cyclase
MLHPSNIMLHRDGRGEHVKVLDFGLTKMLGTHTTKVILTDDIYASGSFDIVPVIKCEDKYVDTFGYMSPEQLMGKRAQPASDLYALGAVLYEMLAGQRPFNPETPDDLLKLQRAGLKVNICDLRPDLPPTVEAVVLKALAFEPHDRYRSAEEFGTAIAHAFGSKTEGVLTHELQQRAHVLFMDLVGYSGLTIIEQRRRCEKLINIVRATNEFQQSQASDQVICVYTGDGIALVFSGDNPVAAVKCALEIAGVLKNNPDLKLRMGLHTGTVKAIANIKDTPGAAGDCLNIAQRVMNCGDAGHILLSETVANELRPLIGWSGYLRDWGDRIDEHGYRMRIFNLFTGEIGNP